MRSRKFLKSRIRQIVKSIRFTNSQKNKQIELCILRAIETIRADKRKAMLKRRQAVGRPQQLLYRRILIGAIFRSWQIGMGEKSKIPKRLPGFKPNTFINFATQILWLEGISNVIDNLDEYRTEANRLERQHWICVFGSK